MSILTAVDTESYIVASSHITIYAIFSKIKGVTDKEYFGLIEKFSTYRSVIFNYVLDIYGFKFF